ncbi:fatty acid hydroxylase family protein [Rhodanobacter denitrificans]|uniref:Fatty acid hydroxylase family protein n=1 Tax=Rhodanobacter denitrificans TaxID=666685 RepID=A0A368KG05_9GAMM|nr:sterol desaturase family protein [Rhodanobacter denitrificans]RCS30840.1 fatty acid hydroxylase family protein [Rhodanobacter denitrificans]
MPTPIEVLLDPISLTVFAIYATLILCEHFFPARELPRAPAWRIRGLAAFALFFALSIYLPLLWTEHLLPWQLFDLSHLGTATGALVGVLVYECIGYFYHRGMHASDLLWRILHQMHHSAERVDAWSAFWFHPFDMIGWTVVSSLALTLVVGLSASATTASLLVFTLLSIFQHTNVRTPRWLGYIVQRPESHSWHHARGRHRNNYADLPLFDILFGTLDNPGDFAPATGFYDGASSRLGDMLLFREVSTNPLKHGNPGEPASPHPTK